MDFIVYKDVKNSKEDNYKISINNVSIYRIIRYN